MNLYNIKDNSEQVSFAQAVRQGLGREQGLFFPEQLEPLADVDALLDLPLAERSARILSHLLGDEVPAAKVSEHLAVLERRGVDGIILFAFNDLD